MIVIIEGWRRETRKEIICRLTDMFGAPGPQNSFNFVSGEYKGPESDECRWGYGQQRGYSKVLYFRHEADAAMAHLSFPSRMIGPGIKFAMI